MGQVYEVEHIGLGVHYALKTIVFKNDYDEDAESSERTTELLRTKFLEDGQMLARLKHPHLIRVFDLAIDEETRAPYYVMDLVLYKDGNPQGNQQILYTPRYVAPEVEAGEVPTLEADAYSLGIAIFKPLTCVWYVSGSDALALLNGRRYRWSSSSRWTISIDIAATAGLGEAPSPAASITALGWPSDDGGYG